MVTIETEDFRKCTTKTIRNDGKTTITCKLGLWSVDAWHEINAVTEALHYFRQYKSDGEYSSIISGKTIADTIKSMRET